MVSRGFVPSASPIPAPDMSFARLLADATVGWQQRGQYAIWTGANAPGDPKFQFLERHQNRVAVIASKDGGAVMHKVASGTAFTIENVMGYWLSFDCDAIWLDLPNQNGQYAMLAVGGAIGKPAHAEIDCPCPRCGTALGRQSVAIGPRGFDRLLDSAEVWVAEFNGTEQMRKCPHCGGVHPATYGLVRDKSQQPHIGG